MQFLSRNDLQAIAQSKFDDAILLYHHSRYSTAYYLGGLAIEMAIKACIARVFIKDSIPPLKLVQAIFQHNLDNLAKISSLYEDLEEKKSSNSIFRGYWGIISQWSIDQRYAMIDAATSAALLTAIADPKNGVFPWIKERW